MPNLELNQLFIAPREMNLFAKIQNHIVDNRIFGLGHCYEEQLQSIRNRDTAFFGVTDRDISCPVCRGIRACGRSGRDDFP